MGVMFIMNGVVRFVIGVRDIRFTDGERFIISARTFKEMTGLKEGLAIKITQGITVVTDRYRRDCPVLVPQQNPHRQIHARVFR